MILEETYKLAINSEKNFTKKQVLFVGSESYDAPTITIIKGLNKLGFKIYTIGKGNINSCFCNIIIENPNKFVFDFVLSNLHWGTRWSYYDKYNLHQYKKILIDGDDNHNEKNWKDKYLRYIKKYPTIENSDIYKSKEFFEERWVEPLAGYQPDIVFCAQKNFSDSLSNYLPFGIDDDYYRYYKQGQKKENFLAHIKGQGAKRYKASKFLNLLSRYFDLFSFKVFDEFVYGDKKYPNYLPEAANNDKNIHSYHRYSYNDNYNKILSSTKIVLYPGVEDMPYWDSKRPWEAYACKCLVMLGKPNIDMSEYPVTELCAFTNYSTYAELYAKLVYLKKKPMFLEKIRIPTVFKAQKYFNTQTLAKYFLYKISIHDG